MSTSDKLDDQEVVVPGVAVYTIGTLKNNIARKFEDLARRVKIGDLYEMRLIEQHMEEGNVLKVMIKALKDELENLKQDPRFQDQIEEDTHGAKTGSQVKGDEPMPKKQKAGKAPSSPHPMRSRLVGENQISESQVQALWRTYKSKNK